jgi:NOL1/NOP2/fmu family ribosome biogenesis protein
MKEVRIQNSKEVKRIHAQLFDQFGFSDKLPYVFLLSNRDRLNIIHRDMEQLPLDQLRLDSLGLYFATITDGELRLSIDGSQIIGPHATKNIVELSDEEFSTYIKGENMELHEEYPIGIYLVKHRQDFVGSCKISGKKLTNFVPKARRLKVVNA